MSDLWGTLAGIGASLWDSSKEDDRAEQASNTAKELSPNVTQQASMWQNQQNMGNQTWAQRQNQAAMDKAGVGTNTDAFGTSSRTQNADGSWNLTNAMNPGDQAMLDALRRGNATGIGNLDMTGAYNIDGTYARNFDALNRPNLERNQRAQREQAAAMGMGWGSGKGNDVLQSQLNDESTRFGLSVQNAGHDEWNADQAMLKANLGLGDSMMNNLKGRQTAAPEWGKYATVNAPSSHIVNKGDINSNLGWAASTGGGNADGTMPGYANWANPTTSAGGWSGGALSGVNGSGGGTSWNGGGWTNGEAVGENTGAYESWLSGINGLNDMYGSLGPLGSALPGGMVAGALAGISNWYDANYGLTAPTTADMGNGGWGNLGGMGVGTLDGGWNSPSTGTAYSGGSYGGWGGGYSSDNGRGGYSSGPNSSPSGSNSGD